MVVFFDIDGTIIDEQTQSIPESAVRAIRRLRENGHIPVVNTGRPYTHIDPRVREMAFAGWVCGCGMEVLLDGKWIVREMPLTEKCIFSYPIAGMTDSILINVNFIHKQHRITMREIFFKFFSIHPVKVRWLHFSE